jgi:beta-galactosidase
MRQTIPFNAGWTFVKKDLPLEKALLETGESVILPHTWNNIDGQDGGNDYLRQRCWYLKNFKSTVNNGEKVYLEIEAASQKAEVFLNGKRIGEHKGGYSIFRFELTPYLKEDNLLAISVDNSVSDEIYPQYADFTFYGGLTRNVNLMVVPATHFALLDHGSKGFTAVPVKKEDGWYLECLGKLEGEKGGEAIAVSLIDKGGKTVAQKEIKPGVKSDLKVTDPFLWDGLEDPYLYKVEAVLASNGEILDQVSFNIGFRTYSFDADKGFFLNGRSYPLHGVARHQDRKGKGSAISEADMDEDMALIEEIGANTIRLSHYEHSQHFYDLADAKGMIVWTEIPVITIPIAHGLENAKSQLTELISQCREHPSIICWGLSNEISMRGVNQEMIDDHLALNALAHKLDPTRLTSMAHIGNLPIDSPLVKVPDISAYNLYMGWYYGNVNQFGTWMDVFHQTNPEVKIGLTEYGADANPLYHSADPKPGDYTESYQVYYHHHMLEAFKGRPFIWGTYVWNMFDFGVDSRNEGGLAGFNQKGLVTADRKTKKDSFYLYKAYWSKEKFVRIAERRYVNREEKAEKILVFSNLQTISLFVDNEPPIKREGDKVFSFDVTLKNGPHEIKAIGGDCSDVIRFNVVDDNHGEYQAKAPTGLVSNWFDNADELTAPEGKFSIKDKVSEILKSSEAKSVLMKIFSNTASKNGQGPEIDENLLGMMASQTMESLLFRASSQDKRINKDAVKQVNAILNTIDKPNNSKKGQ